MRVNVRDVTINIFAEDIANVEQMLGCDSRTGNYRRELSRGGLQSARPLTRRTGDRRSLFESRTLGRICPKQRFPTKNARALRFKKGAPLRSEKRRTILSPIEF